LECAFGHFCRRFTKITKTIISRDPAALSSFYFVTFFTPTFYLFLQIFLTMKPISAELRDRVLAHIDNGLSDRKVATIVGISRSSVQNIRQQYRSNTPTAKDGRPLRLSSQDKRFLVRAVTSGELDTAVKANKKLRTELSVSVSDRTVCRVLVEAGLKSSPKVEKPLLSRKNIKARLEFAKRHQHWTAADWERVIWSDETKINRFNSDGRSWCWIRDVDGLEPRTVKKTVKHGGGSIMIWGCMTVHGPGFMCKLDSTMDRHVYKDILEEELAATIEYYDMDPSKVIFQHDNDPKHTAKSVREWLEEQQFEVLTWPAQSPDLNPIEHLWAWLKIRLNQYERAPTGMLELWDRVQDVWNGFGTEECVKLIHTMPKRIEAVLKSKGYWTDY
jgi:transposase